MFERRKKGEVKKTEKGRYTSERPLCHDSSTSANDVGAAEVDSVNSDIMVMKRSNRDSCVMFIFGSNHR